MSQQMLLKNPTIMPNGPSKQNESLMFGIELLYTIGQLVNETSLIEPALQQAITQVCQQTNWEIGNVYLTDSLLPDTLIATKIGFASNPNLRAQLEPLIHEVRFTSGEDLPGQVLASQEPFQIEDLRNEPQYGRLRRLVGCGILSALAFPIQSGNQVVGVVELLSERTNAPDPALFELLHQVGLLLGRVIERQIAQIQLKRLQILLTFSNELLVTAALDTTLQNALRAMIDSLPHAQRGYIYLADEQRGRLALRASMGLGQLPIASVLVGSGLIGSVYVNQQALVLASPEVIATKLAKRNLAALGLRRAPGALWLLPLVAQSVAVGVVLLVSDDGAITSTPDILSTLEGLATLLATAIVNRRVSVNEPRSNVERSSPTEGSEWEVSRTVLAGSGVLQAARLAAVGELSTSIAHEVNNPLYAARSALQLLADDLAQIRAGSPYLEIARDELSRIASIMQRIRDFARPPLGQLQLHDLNQLIAETLQLAEPSEHAAGAEVHFDRGSELPLVRCDSTQIRQALLNLVLNALDAMPNGGTLTMSSSTNDNHVVIEVRDTGAGIPDNVRPHLFEPFFTTKAGGTGLGLATAAHIVDLHGGQIEVESTLGHGSTFRIRLPV
jgi:two-component system NtrC family sensor kinase